MCVTTHFSNPPWALALNFRSNYRFKRLWLVTPQHLQTKVKIWLPSHNYKFFEGIWWTENPEERQVNYQNHLTKFSETSAIPLGIFHTNVHRWHYVIFVNCSGNNGLQSHSHGCTQKTKKEKMRRYIIGKKPKNSFKVSKIPPHPIRW